MKPELPSLETASNVRSRVAAVVLAGGQSRRFGSDKLVARIGERTLLECAIGELPEDWLIILVGPDRELSPDIIDRRRVITVREDPPGGGPAAGLVAGVAAALAQGVEIVAALPGDAPSGGRAATALVAEIGGGSAVVATDDQGREQPLQFAAGVGSVRRLASRTDTFGIPARELLGDLGSYRRIRLEPALTADVDRPDDLTLLLERSEQGAGRTTATRPPRSPQRKSQTGRAGQGSGLA